MLPDDSEFLWTNFIQGRMANLAASNIILVTNSELEVGSMLKCRTVGYWCKTLLYWLAASRFDLLALMLVFSSPGLQATHWHRTSAVFTCSYKMK